MRDQLRFGVLINDHSSIELDWVHRHQVPGLLPWTWKVHISKSGQWDLANSIHV